MDIELCVGLLDLTYVGPKRRACFWSWWCISPRNCSNIQRQIGCLISLSIIPELLCSIVHALLEKRGKLSRPVAVCYLQNHKEIHYQDQKFQWRIIHRGKNWNRGISNRQNIFEGGLSSHVHGRDLKHVLFPVLLSRTLTQGTFLLAVLFNPLIHRLHTNNLIHLPSQRPSTTQQTTSSPTKHFITTSAPFLIYINNNV